VYQNKTINFNNKIGIKLRRIAGVLDFLIPENLHNSESSYVKYLVSKSWVKNEGES